MKKALNRTLSIFVVVFSQIFIGVMAQALEANMPDVCETQGAVMICNKYGTETGGYEIRYTGYLLAEVIDASTQIRVGGKINNLGLFGCLGGGDAVREEPLARGKTICAIGLGADRTHHIELYFVDNRGRYDSRYGSNYHFVFRFDDKGQAIVDGAKVVR